MPKYFTANELVSLLDEIVSVWNTEGGEESQPLLQEDNPRFRIKTGEDGAEAGFEISFFDLNATNLEDRFKSYQQAHEFSRYLQTRSFSRQLNAGDAGMTKKIIRPRIIMMNNPRESAGFVYKVFIPAAYKDHLTRFSQRTLYKRWRARFLNSYIVRWTQRIFSALMAFQQAQFLHVSRLKYIYPKFENRSQNLREGFETVYIPTENGCVLQGFEKTVSSKNGDQPQTAILFGHGNGEFAAENVGEYSYFFLGAQETNQPTTLQIIDLPGYGVSSGLSRSLNDIEDAYFDAAKKLIDRGHTHIHLVARSLSGFPMPEVALRLQRYVKKNNLPVAVTLFCERTGRSVFGTLIGYILDLFHEAKLKRLRKHWAEISWKDQAKKTTAAQVAQAKYDRIAQHPFLSLNPLQWVGFALLSVMAFIFVYPLALITRWERNSVRTLSQLEKGSYEVFNGTRDNVISRIGLGMGMALSTRRKIKTLKAKITALENTPVPNQETLNHLKHKRLKLWQLEARLVSGGGFMVEAGDIDEHNKPITEMYAEVTLLPGQDEMRLYANQKYGLFYRGTQSVYSLKRTHREHKHEHFGSFFKPSRKRNAVEFDQYHANKKARHAESAKIADEFFPGRQWTR